MMLKIISDLIELVFPARPTQKRVALIEFNDIKDIYNPGNYSGITYLSHYQDENIKSLVLENKFHHNQTAAKFLAAILSLWLLEQKTTLTLVPIPLSQKRQKERGYNQVLEVLNQLPTSLSHTIEPKLLKRIKNIVPQTSLPRAERLKNTTGVFTVNSSIAVSSDLVILIDDVVTTGATLKAAAAALTPYLKADTKIICLALAH